MIEFSKMWFVGGGYGGGCEGYIEEMYSLPFEGAGVFVLRVELESKSVPLTVMRRCSAVLAVNKFEAGVSCVYCGDLCWFCAVLHMAASLFCSSADLFFVFMLFAL